MNKAFIVFLIIIFLGFIGYKFYKMPILSNGEVSLDFTATIKDGSTFSLSDLKGKYVLLDFWGSWCGPCRKDNKDLVLLKQEFPQLEIVSVSIESNKSQWEKAILKDKLDWKYHIVQLDRFNSPIAKLYGIKEIPTKYLINPDQKIIGVNLPTKETKRLLKNKL